MNNNKEESKSPLKLEKNFETKWYSKWEENNFFSSNPNPKKKPYVVVMPPPNVTGILHMGHILNNTIQDVLVRKARMQGKEVCWVPGTDHASIATEAKVVNMLKEKGIEKTTLSRKEFLEYAWQWKEKHGDIIINQLKKLGVSCDWNRLKFTLDADLSESVINTFIDLYNEGYIYRGNRMINWDPQSKTALSDDEVFYKEIEGTLYYIKYKISGTSEFITIATSRPETIMGDAAICVNPKDKRYKHLVGKNAIIPIINKVIPIIEDKYVSTEFGTGCLKVTPAHDMNDAKIGLRHKLEFIDIFNDDGTLNEQAQIYVGFDRFEARKKIVEQLKKDNLIEKEEKYKQNIGYSERTNAVVEPKISTQWFVKMEELVKPALENVLNDTIKFYPSKFKNMYQVWIENIKDWCISRQLWWGHRIPAYYLKDGSFVVAKNIDEAFIKAKKINPKIKINEIRQDEDVLDTWFSSWLWPISVFDGINNPENEDFKYYFPTNDLVTAPEIIFFWVARMIIASYKLKNTYPFKNVYFTGIVRDNQKRKMSKSLGNSPDPLKLMEKYTIDGVRAGMLFSSPAGNDLLFDEKLCEQGRNFVNKLWNATKLIKSWEQNLAKNKSKKTKPSKVETIAIEWLEAKINFTLKELEYCFNKFKISEALILIYKLIWDDFCSKFLEIIKTLNNEVSPKTIKDLKSNYEKLLKILHPFMPFITEEIWHILNEREIKEYITVSEWPTPEKFDQTIIKYEEYAFELISRIRNIRKQKNIKNTVKIILAIDDEANWFNGFKDIIINLSNIEIKNLSKTEGIPINVYKSTFHIILEENINDDDEIIKLEKEIQYYNEFLKNITTKLNNNKFIEKAPEKIINIELQKKKDTENKIKSLQLELSKFTQKN